MLLNKIKIEEKLSVEEIRVLTMLTQKEFAAALEIPYSTYTKKERGDVRFFANEIGAISHRFGVPIDKIDM